jgi:FtsH-binding integral membrane protein
MQARNLLRNAHLILAIGLSLACPLVLQAQTSVAPTFERAVTDIRTIAVAAGTLVAGLVGLIGLGRTAYKLSQGDTDSMTALIFAIVGIVLGFLANTFIA